nr:LicD family protein [Butyrivibrio sp.]
MPHSIEELNKIHESDYALLEEVDRVCKKHNIRYFLHGGTFLGAIRHKDIIPWDDDIDLTFPRKDYLKFKEIFPKECSENFKFIDHMDYKEFYDFIPKIAYTSHTIKSSYGHEDFYHKRYSYILLDIFILDPVPKFHKLQLFILKSLYGLAMGHRPVIDYKKYSNFQKIFIWLLSSIGHIVPFKFVARIYDSVSKWGKEPSDYSKIFLSNEQPHPHYWGLTFDKEMYDGRSKATFHGKEYVCPGRYDEWLSYV